MVFNQIGGMLALGNGLLPIADCGAAGRAAPRTSRYCAVAPLPVQAG